MKTSRYILIATAGLLIGLSNTALARPKAQADINHGGRQGFNVGHRNDYGRGSYRTAPRYNYCEPVRSCPQGQTIIIGNLSQHGFAGFLRLIISN
ncbi:MAG: hypothetical protein PHY02_03365 [Phycisphaerae bacterium]|nr:hypothetical protein [Phycisphaerae bacterium]